MLRVRDALQREIKLPAPPRRILSLVPSDTWSIHQLGASHLLIGRTDYCVEPPELVDRVPSVGGTKNPDLQKILDLRPQLILANQEENSRGDIERLIAAHIQVYVSFPRRVAEGFSHLAALARLLHREQEPAAKELIRAAYQLQQPDYPRPLRAFCPIWMDPLMTINDDTFISDALAWVGASNVFAGRERRYPLAADLGKIAPLTPDKTTGRDTRYPRVTVDEVIAHAPELVLLPDEPHPFSEADADFFRSLPIPAARNGGVIRCSGKDLCWYGAWAVEGLPRMKKFMDELRASLAVATPPQA